MAAWHRSRRADLGLRALGLGFCAMAYLAIARLVALSHPQQAASALGIALAAIGVVCGIVGSALTMLGKHLFDDVQVSTRWQHRSIHDPYARARWLEGEQ
ncbi:hypothetical protein [uncultured Sphingomonas sp.]|uniref:hypothetical protein n=1 Tax=uncultured Sphingomonas sp. TaxID=158754 RepID=UPI0025EE7B04|nr:hypothetical protein [uncultured Sphingomonas sp.]